MLRDVKHNVSDGLLGFATATGDGLHIKLGVSPVVSDTPIIVTGDMDAAKIKSRLGLSPLADAVMDAVQFGASRVYCLPVTATTAGTLGEITKTGDGGGSVAVDGSPTNAFAVIVKITAQGGLNTAAFVVSIDGGYSFSDETTVPLTGSYELAGTGLKLTFTEAEAEDQKPSSFIVNDTYSFQTTAPVATNGDILAALEKLTKFNQEVEFAHIVGASTLPLWQAVSEFQKELMEIHHKPMFFLMEAEYPTEGEDGALHDWAFQMEADRMEKSLERAKVTLEREPTKKVNLGGSGDQADDSGEYGSRSSGDGKTVIIQKLLMQVDLKKIKDLQMLLALLEEVEDYTNGNGDEDPSGDSDAVPTPA